MTMFSEVSILVASAAFKTKSARGIYASSGGSINLLDDTEGNRFLLWCNHFGHVIFTRLKLLW